MIALDLLCCLSVRVTVLHGRSVRPQDEVIERFEARYAEARAEAVQHREKLSDTQQQLESSQIRVKELVDSKAHLQQQLDQAAAMAAAESATLRQEVARLQV